jgi:hypothetical protein
VTLSALLHGDCNSFVAVTAGAESSALSERLRGFNLARPAFALVSRQTVPSGMFMLRAISRKPMPLAWAVLILLPNDPAEISAAHCSACQWCLAVFPLAHVQMNGYPGFGRKQAKLPMTVIEITPYRNGWQVYEAPGVQPVFFNPRTSGFKSANLCLHENHSFGYDPI